MTQFHAPAHGVRRRSLVQGAAWTVPAIALTTAAPAFAASQTGTLTAIGSGTNSQTLTATIPCGRPVTYTVIGGGGGGGAGSTAMTGGDGDMITGSFSLDCSCGSTKTLTIVAAGGGAGGQRNNTAAPSPSFATGGAGFGKGGNSGDVSQGSQYTNEYFLSALNNNYMYGGGGGGGSAILIGTAPVIVAGGGGGGGTVRMADNITNGGTQASHSVGNPTGGDAAPGAINGTPGTSTITTSSDTPNILNQNVTANGGRGAVGATPGAGAPVGSETYKEGTIIDNGDLQSYTAPAPILLTGVAGGAPSAAGGAGADGVQAVHLWHAPYDATYSLRGVYSNHGSPGGGGGYAGGGSGGLTLGSSGTVVSSSSVRRTTGAATGGGGAGSYLTTPVASCITGLSVTGPVVPSVTLPLSAYGSGGNGGSFSTAVQAGEVGYVKLSW